MGVGAWLKDGIKTLAEALSQHPSLEVFITLISIIKFLLSSLLM